MYVLVFGKDCCFGVVVKVGLCYCLVYCVVVIDDRGIVQREICILKEIRFDMLGLCFRLIDGGCVIVC